jgi:hypothetical protein
MSLESTPSAEHESDRGFPVVVPPSGRFIAQLFLVPFLIVSSVVGVLLLVQWLAGGARSPADYLTRLDNPNSDVRWRGAEELAQVLRRDDQLASDVGFSLDLAERLQKALHDTAGKSKEPSRKPLSRETPSPAEADEDPAQVYLFYLSGCLGNMALPVGAPLLGEMALDGKAEDANALAQRRRRAMWVLTQLGDNMKRFDRLQDARRTVVLDHLRTEAGRAMGQRRTWAAATLAYLEGPEAKSLHVLGLDDVFAKCAEDQDPLLRSLVAFALNFWEGLPSESARMEQLLIKLARDDGHGEEILAKLRPQDPQGIEAITRSPGLAIRFNANIALARRGSPKVRLDVIAEMLDERALRENFRVKVKGGEDVPDEEIVANTLDATLRAISELHRLRPELDLSHLRDALDTLARSSNMNIRSEAERTLKSLGFVG